MLAYLQRSIVVCFCKPVTVAQPANSCSVRSADAMHLDQMSITPVQSERRNGRLACGGVCTYARTMWLLQASNMHVL
jgi:hypothetical protein